MLYLHGYAFLRYLYTTMKHMVRNMIMAAVMMLPAAVAEGAIRISAMPIGQGGDRKCVSTDA